MTSTPNAPAFDRCPDKPWGSVWCCAAIVFLGLAASLEGMWRSRGHQPSVADSPRMWSWTRSQVAAEPVNTVVVLGDSRMQLGFDVPTARQQLNRSVVQLSIAGGGSPLAALEDLAADPTFRGRVIAGVVPGWFENPAVLHDQYLAYHRVNMAVFDGFETWVGAELSSWLVVKRSSCNLRTSVGSLLRRRFPAPVPRIMDINRQIHSDFSQVNDLTKLRAELLRELQSERAGKPAGSPSATWPAVVQRYRDAARAIQQRGGRVVFVEMPTSGPRVPLDQTAYPREKFWDVFAETVRPVAITIHFEDYEDLRAFECPDMSHLDMRDASPFTEALLKHIQ